MIWNSDANNIMDFEDMKIFIKENEQRIEIQSLLSKKNHLSTLEKQKEKLKKSLSNNDHDILKKNNDIKENNHK